MRTWLLLVGLGTWVSGAAIEVPELPAAVPQDRVRWVEWSDPGQMQSVVWRAGELPGERVCTSEGLGFRLGWGWSEPLRPLVSRVHPTDWWGAGFGGGAYWTLGLRQPDVLVLSRFFPGTAQGHPEEWSIRARSGWEMVYGWMHGDRVFWMERSFSSQGGVGHTSIRSARRDHLEEVMENGRWDGPLPARSSGFWELEDYIVWADAGEGLVSLSKDGTQMAAVATEGLREELVRMHHAEGWIWNEGNALYRGNDSSVVHFDLGALAAGMTFQDISPVGFWRQWSLTPSFLGAGWLLFLVTCVAWSWQHGWSRWSRRLERVSLVGGMPGVSSPPAGADAEEEEAVRIRLAAVAEGVEWASIAHWSPALRLVLLQEQRMFTTSELDAMLGIEDIASPETLRARRSRIIQMVNAEFNLLYGMDLILRDRDREDRRKSVYRLAHLPPTLQKFLHRNGMHQFHANDGTHRTDCVSEDREEHADWGEGR